MKLIFAAAAIPFVFNLSASAADVQPPSPPPGQSLETECVVVLGIKTIDAYLALAQVTKLQADLAAAQAALKAASPPASATPNK